VSEKSDSIVLANKLLNEPNCDPDDDLRILSRQLLRRAAVIDELEKELSARYDPMAGLIEANRDCILEKHQEAIQLIADLTRNVGSSSWSWELSQKINSILDALSMFHPMHGESWSGWPKEQRHE